ncbi:MAG: exosome complex exonuclease Rrp41 [Candidatus Micrarchaeota archaeon]|nr:exosome complex exonuclease Rrp41 [Candidatus Micrarchaeota archaeon]
MENIPKLLDEQGRRIDGRAVDELRPISIKAGVLNNADGSAFIRWGNNKILVAVYGPRECIPKHESSPYRAQLRCRYNMAPFCSLAEHGKSGPSRRSMELSKIIGETFEKVVITENFPKTAIDIFIDVLQSDGGTRCAAVTATTVALADAGIPLKDMVAAVAVGKIENKVVLDLSKDEDNFGQSDNPIAIGVRDEQIFLYQMDGLLTKEEIKEGLRMAFAAIKKIHSLQLKALEENYTSQEHQKFISLNMPTFKI